jgi:hypothetical protein
MPGDPDGDGDADADDPDAAVAAGDLLAAVVPDVQAAVARRPQTATTDPPSRSAETEVTDLRTRTPSPHAHGT